MNKKIVVIDDEPDISRFLSRLLEDNGYHSVSTNDSRSALELIKSENPDLILLDIQMPNNTGADLYRRIRNKKETKDIPIIVVSGIAGRHLSTNKDIPVIDKPIDEKKLLEEVEKALG